MSSHKKPHNNHQRQDKIPFGQKLANMDVKLAEAQLLCSKKESESRNKGIKIYKNLIEVTGNELESLKPRQNDGDSEIVARFEFLIKLEEQYILELAEVYFKLKDSTELSDLIKVTRSFLPMISKAKAAKLVTTFVDYFLNLETGTEQEVELCNECIAWANNDSRTYLRQALESRLIEVYYKRGQYQDGLKLITTLLRELKKLDDKQLLVQVQLVESKIFYALGNLAKARGALTSGRTTANGIHCPPKLQADLDLQSGILHAADERDFKTAFSYFMEAFEGYLQFTVTHDKAVTALKYMLLSKIMMNSASEISSILSSKSAVKLLSTISESDTSTSRQNHIKAMKKIGLASESRSLGDFQKVVDTYKVECHDDPIVSSHLDTLYDTMLEQNLCRILEPYSKVQIEHVASVINLPVETVERKLSQMILDKKFNGILDQGAGVLTIVDELKQDKTYDDALSVIRHMNQTVDHLYKKAIQIK